MNRSLLVLGHGELCKQTAITKHTRLCVLPVYASFCVKCGIIVLPIFANVAWRRTVSCNLPVVIVAHHLRFLFRRVWIVLPALLSDIFLIT